jgi:hypothetical protein
MLIIKSLIFQSKVVNEVFIFTGIMIINFDALIRMMNFSDYYFHLIQN